MAAMSRRPPSSARDWPRQPRPRESTWRRLTAAIIVTTAASRRWPTPRVKAGCSFNPAACGLAIWEHLMGRDRDRDREVRADNMEERVVKIRRCAAVVKGG